MYVYSKILLATLVPLALGHQVLSAPEGRRASPGSPDPGADRLFWLRSIDERPNNKKDSLPHPPIPPPPPS